MTNLIHLEELLYAKKVTNDFPDAIKKIDICYKELYNYKDYIDINVILKQLEESKCMMELTLHVYTKVLKEVKGKDNV